jgi:GNAT superfamily N-acetyltransferase
MKLVRIFNLGRVISQPLYCQLQELDKQIFYGCGNEFKTNRDWWVIEHNGKIIAYCGCIYTEGICIFNRAWVHRKHRGKGIQSKMIKARLKAAKGSCSVAITYTTFDNIPSANNLIKNKFVLYNPLYAYAGEDKLYFIKQIKLNT